MSGKEPWRVGSLVVTTYEALGVTSSPTGEIYVVGGQKVYEVDGMKRKSVIYAGGGRDGVSEGKRLEVSFTSPHGIGMTPNGAVLVTCTGDHCVYLIEKEEVKRFAGSSKGWNDGPALEAKFDSPQRIVELNGSYYIPDCWNHSIRVINGGMVSTIGTRSTSYRTGSFNECSIPYTRGIGVGLGNTIVVASSGPHKITLLDMDSQQMTFIAGNETKSFEDGEAKRAKFNFPFDVTVSPQGDIYVADDDNHRIRKVQAGDHLVSTFVGPADGSKTLDGLLTDATTHAPTGICISHDGALLWTERTGKLRYIEKFAPEKKIVRDPLPGFASLLEGQGELFPHHKFHIPSIDTTFFIHECILGLWEIKIENIQTLARFNLPKEIIHQFLSLLYGSFENDLASLETLDKIEKLACFDFLAEVLNISSIQDWALTFIAPHWSSLSPADHFELFQRLVIKFNLPYPSLVPYLNKLALHSSDSANTHLNKRLAELPSGEASQIQELLILDTGTNYTYEKRAAKISSLAEDATGRRKSDPLKPMKKHLKALYHLSTAPQTANSTNFTFFIPGESSHSSFKVHDWVLYPRWSFFKFMIDSGMDEAKSRKAELPSDFPALALQMLLQYIYTGKVNEAESSEAKEACSFLLEFGALYGLLSPEGEPTKGFTTLIKYCSRMLK